jgi:hypothetical protein
MLTRNSAGVVVGAAAVVAGADAGVDPPLHAAATAATPMKANDQCFEAL